MWPTINEPGRRRSYVKLSKSEFETSRTKIKSYYTELETCVTQWERELENCRKTGEWDGTRGKCQKISGGQK
jgi:hypothetical protein